MNQLTGQIPSELGMIKTLEILYLCQNQFEGSIPAEIFSIPTLKEITLCQNQISGTIPTEFAGSARSFDEHISSDFADGVGSFDAHTSSDRRAFNSLQVLDVGKGLLCFD